MRRGPRPAGRAGFTLIELLVVISILALLAALVAAGISKVKEAQQGRTTDQTLTKLQLALDKQWKAICDQCRDDRRNKADAYTSLLSFCDNDAERAEALWMYINLRRDLPQTYSEAHGDLCPNVAQRNGTAPFTVPLPPDKRGAWLWYPAVPANAAVLVAPSRSTFKSVPKMDMGTVDEMSAVLLYLILTERGTRGSNFSADDAMQGAQVAIKVDGSEHQVFKDAFGSPISFVRYFQHPELNQPPYVRANLQITDALDPVGRLGLWANNPKMKAAEQTAGTLFNRQNRLATVYSLGANQTADRDGLGALNPLGESDDHFGYRIVRQGNKGD